MDDCLFCKIINGDIPSEIVYEDRHVIAFKDINPCAPVHALVVPRKHIDGVDTINGEDAVIVGALFLSIGAIADKLGVAENGYRVITNVGEHGGQTVRHLHFHLIGGAKLSSSVAKLE